MSLRGLLNKLEDELTHCSEEAYFSKENVLKAVNMLQLEYQLSNGKESSWIPVEERLPDPDEYLLVSFENFSVPMVGRYTVDDEDNGTFRVGNSNETFVEHDLFVNAWMPLPEPYKEG